MNSPRTDPDLIQRTNVAVVVCSQFPVKPDPFASFNIQTYQMVLKDQFLRDWKTSITINFNRSRCNKTIDFKVMF